MDCLPLQEVDIVHDLNMFPYPFKNDEVDELWMDNVLEHLSCPVRVMEEIFRICSDGAIVHISVPYFRSAYAFIDPTHLNYFGINWFNYFDPNHTFQQKYSYSKVTFRVNNIEFDREWKKKGPFQKLIIWIANKRPDFYEFKLSHLVPLHSLYFNLSVIKRN